MPEIALSLHLEVDELFPIAEVLQSLGFADVREGDIFLTPPARAFADGDVQARKVLFAEHLLRYVPLAALIKNVLDERRGHRRACVSSRSWRTRCRTAPPKRRWIR